MSASLAVYLDDTRVGLLADAGGTVRFTYDSSYLERTGARPISGSLPLQHEALAQRATLAFFGGLLPEEGQRKQVAALLQLSEGNVIALLEALGGDCAGAITLLPEGTPFPLPGAAAKQSETPIPLGPDELDERLRRTTDDPLAASSDGEIRLSLAGAQAKLPVIWDNGSASLPRSPQTPTTHILKPASTTIPALVANEFFCMRLAAAAGLSTASVELEQTATGLQYLRVARYDRASDERPAKRLHQEDFCQALGIITEQKYENEGGPSLSQVAARLGAISTVPAVDTLGLWSAIVFNVLIGNCDAHGKNFSILWTPSGPRLAPLYDLVSTSVYVPPLLDPPLIARLAMRIGPATFLHEVDRAALEAFASRLGLRPAAMLRRADALAARTVESAHRLASLPQHDASIVPAIIVGIERRAARIAY